MKIGQTALNTHYGMAQNSSKNTHYGAVADRLRTHYGQNEVQALPFTGKAMEKLMAIFSEATAETTGTKIKYLS